jgi:hypothetical protein
MARLAFAEQNLAGLDLSLLAILRLGAWGLGLGARRR